MWNMLVKCENIYHKAAASTYDYFELLSHSKSTRNKLSIALPRVRTKAAQNEFYYQGAMINNSLTRYLYARKWKFVFKKIT